MQRIEEPVWANQSFTVRRDLQKFNRKKKSALQFLLGLPQRITPFLYCRKRSYMQLVQHVQSGTPAFIVCVTYKVLLHKRWLYNQRHRPLFLRVSRLHQQVLLLPYPCFF